MIEYEFAHDQGDPSGGLDAEEAAEYLQRKTGINIDASMLYRLRASGRGPVSLLAGSDGTRWRIGDLHNWSRFAFGRPELQPKPFYPPMQIDRSMQMASERERPLWLYVSPCDPDTEYLRDHLTAWGAEVYGPIELAREAALVADREDFDAAVLSMDWNVDAAVVVTGILQRRRIPYVMLTARDDLPKVLSTGGVVLGHSIHDTRFALETRMPGRSTKGMNFRVETAITWG